MLAHGGFLVPLTGIEPVRYCYRGILSPLCLPVPPQRLIDLQMYSNILFPLCQYLFLFTQLKRLTLLHKTEIFDIIFYYNIL